jgi:hypothetical protein
LDLPALRPQITASDKTGSGYFVSMSNLEVFNIRLAAWANDSRISQSSTTEMLKLLCSEESPLEKDLEV